MALPARSFTPLAPPFAVAVYVVLYASAEAGLSVAVGVSPPANTDAGTRLPAESRSSNDVVLMAAELIISLNVAVTTLVVLTPVAPAPGVTELTVGGVVSPPVPSVDANTTSTQ